MNDPGISSRNETAARPVRARPAGAGRPRRWSSAAEKHRAYRQRQAECQQLLAALLHAVRNASLEEPGLRQAAVDGDDAELLRALVEHYRARHWCRPGKEDAP